MSSDVKRYTNTMYFRQYPDDEEIEGGRFPMRESQDGEYVKFADYAALKSELRRAKEQLEGVKERITELMEAIE